MKGLYTSEVLSLMIGLGDFYLYVNDKVKHEKQFKSLKGIYNDIVKYTGDTFLASDFIQAYDTLIESRTFDNGEGLYTNFFFHKQGIMSTCYFGQIVYLVDSVPAN